MAAATTDPSKYKFNMSGLRVKDPKRSIKFYEFLGMKLLKTDKYADRKFDLYLVGYDSAKAASGGNHVTDREGVIELIHNYGTEDDPDFEVASGNKDPYKGFGHVCVSVDNIQAACKRLEDEGYRFQKRLTDGRMKTIAFALDPDGYWVEIIGQNPAEKTEDIKETDTQGYRMNHTMIRVKDIDKSLKFYKEIMGLSVIRKHEMKEAEFDLYFLAYDSQGPDMSSEGVNPQAGREGILELTYNYGSEKDDSVNYHNGDDGEKGFAHLGFSVDNLEAACRRLEETDVKWKAKLADTNGVAGLFHDPDRYVIAVYQNDSLKKSDGKHSL